MPTPRASAARPAGPGPREAHSDGEGDALPVPGAAVVRTADAVPPPRTAHAPGAAIVPGSAAVPDDLIRREVVPALANAGLLTPGKDVHVLSVPPAAPRRDADQVHIPEDPRVSRPEAAQVHVTIGRVTVLRAAAQGPPPAPAPAQKPPVPDHAAYLARRREDRS